jgi:serine/threonine-protein kinase
MFGMSAIRFLHPREARAREPAAAVAMAVAGGPAPVAPGARVTGGDELDLAFSMLRHQPPSDNVKQRLYDVALEHARRRDLAKAERVLRHLANLDPDFRHAGEKLKKLAGLRNGMAPAVAEPQPKPAAPVVRPAPERDSLSGRTIGRYQLEQQIGRGAMATVYLGLDPKINRRVAIKTIALAEEFGDNDLVNARTQFLREAESAGRLNHPNIITIYDAGEDGQVAYLAMEYFPGKSLSFYSQQGQLLPPKLVFELMARAAEALHYAHGQHVVHRDVKPANLLYDRESDTLKITDFGIARLTDTSRTKTGIILGTPSYMSPEQLAGTNVTGQSDLFSLGITLYQLLCGMPPFRADSIPRLMQKIAHERHEPVRSLREDLPACVDALLDRALAKNPADRYPSGRAMALALRDCCSSFDAQPAIQSS